MLKRYLRHHFLLFLSYWEFLLYCSGSPEGAVSESSLVFFLQPLTPAARDLCCQGIVVAVFERQDVISNRGIESKVSEVFTTGKVCPITAISCFF